jgi:heavy metal translocating P-type ATPase
LKETTLRRSLLAVALAGLSAGLFLRYAGTGPRPELLWTAATLPVVAMLAVSIVRDLLIGRVGVDAIALISMSAALLLGQSLAGVVVAVMYAGGTVLEDFARGRAERELTLLTDRSPRTANRKRGGVLETVPVEQVGVGDLLLVRAGELVPVDGRLADPEASLDESAVTGEPLPERRHMGEMLRSGTVNAGEAFLMEASAAAAESTYTAIVRMVAAAHTAKAPFIRVADRFALFMLPLTLIVAGAAWQISADPIRALAVLVVATPCPLILAAPVAFIGGVSRSARAGVLMKGSAAVESLAAVRTAIFDKTGTLTHGGAELLDVDLAPGRSDHEVLRLMASLEQASHHVLAGAAIEAARRAGLALANPDRVREHRGAGIEGYVEGTAVSAGSRAIVLGDQPLPLWAERSESSYRHQPVLRVFVALDGSLAGILTFGDALRADAAEAIGELRSAGMKRIVMLTGDDAEAARRVASALDIDHVVAHATPADKVATVEEEKRRAATMMIGDGINDAPALATATVGVAMGSRGATASSEAADIVILTDRLRLVAEAVRTAHRTRRIALESIVIGLSLSGVAMVAAAFGLLQPVAGALLQEAIDIAVILNALRALGGGHAQGG